MLLKGSDKQNYMLGCLLIQVSHKTNSDIWGKLIIASITKQKGIIIFNQPEYYQLVSTCFNKKVCLGFKL